MRDGPFHNVHVLLWPHTEPVLSTPPSSGMGLAFLLLYGPSSMWLILCLADAAFTAFANPVEVLE